MQAGSVSIDVNGAATGSGAALALYNAISTIQQADNPLPNPDVKDDDFDGTAREWHDTMLAQNVKVKKAWAREAQAHANVLGQRTIRNTTVTGNLTLDDDLVCVGTRVGNIVLTLPASAPIGAEFDVAEVGGDILHSITLAAPVGETIAGATTVPNNAHRTVFKFDTTKWLAVV